MHFNFALLLKFASLSQDNSNEIQAQIKVEITEECRLAHIFFSKEKSIVEREELLGNLIKLTGENIEPWSGVEE